ncbi:MAG: hypothetical protein KDJ52_05055 [Anaerolineae bacterium]|nr:hypothetical protein [Anaerolineae bacterium]
MAARTVFLSLCLSLMLIGLALIGYSTVRQIACEGQPINNNESPSFEQQILGDRLIGQSFVAPRNNLNRISLMFQTYQRQNTYDVTLRLLEITPDTVNPFDGIERFTTTFNASRLRDKAWHSFVIPKITDSAGKTYLIVLSSPESLYGNAITVGGIERDVYLPGTAYLGPAPLPADFAFRSCYQMPLNEKITILFQQMTHERPGLWGNSIFYGLTLALYLSVLSLFFGLMIKFVK